MIQHRIESCKTQHLNHKSPRRMSPFMRHPQERHDLILSLLHGQFIRTFIDCQPPQVLEFSPFIPNVDKGLWRALKCFLRPKASNLSAGNPCTFIASQDLCVIVSPPPPSLNPTFFYRLQNFRRWRRRRTTIHSRTPPSFFSTLRLFIPV